MLVFTAQKLVFLAVPKAASTSVEAILTDRADQNVSKSRFPKHIPAKSFFKRWNETHRQEGLQLDAFAILRHPIDRLRSWYNYRQRPSTAPEKSTADMSFEEFVNEYLKEVRKPYADIGNQHAFCTDENGKQLIKFLFSYENLRPFEKFIQATFVIECSLPHLNSSEPKAGALSQKAISRLESSNSQEFELYESVRVDGFKEF